MCWVWLSMLSKYKYVNKYMLFLFNARSDLISTSLAKGINSKYLSEALLHREVNGRVQQLYQEFHILYAEKIILGSESGNEVVASLATVFLQSNSVTALAITRISPSTRSQHKIAFHHTAIPLLYFYSNSLTDKYVIFTINKNGC